MFEISMMNSRALLRFKSGSDIFPVVHDEISSRRRLWIAERDSGPSFPASQALVSCSLFLALTSSPP
ncbi:hypothetical protein DMJ13_17215 [halophilic archaeon]|nr:hypothetical protein DMJ13_17215 [halophilic archaeon]